MAKTTAVRLVDIAREVGVSPVTVGSVLLGSGKGSVRVGKATSEKVMRVAKDMGYRPNTAARQLKGINSRSIGVLVDTHAPTVLGQKIAAIEHCCMQNGYMLILGQAHNDIRAFRRYVDDFVSRGIDGLICASHAYPDAENVIKQLLKDIPNVLFMDKPKVETPCHYIEVDLGDGVSQAVHHLAQSGHDRIAMILMEPRGFRTRRITGFTDAIQKLGLAEFEGQIRWLEDRSTKLIDTSLVADEVSSLIREQGVDALICINDIVAGHAIQACKRLGCRVPRDVAVVGCDNSDFATVMDPQLTTIDHQVNEFAGQAAEILFSRILDDTVEDSTPAQVLVKPRLVVRDSA